MAYYQKRHDSEHGGPVTLVLLGVLVVAGLVAFNMLAGAWSKAGTDLSFLWAMAGPPRFADAEQRLKGEAISVPRPLSSEEMAAISPVGVVRNYEYCEVGAAPAFREGMERLRHAVGTDMGVPMECEHSVANGSTMQKTSTGTATFEGGTAQFSNGVVAWTLTADGALTAEEIPAP